MTNRLNDEFMKSMEGFDDNTDPIYVDVNVDPELQGKANFVCKQSKKMGGTLVCLEIGGLIFADQNNIEIEVRTSTPKDFIGSNFKETDRLVVHHMENENEIILDDSNTQQSFWKEVGVLFSVTPLKVFVSSIYGSILHIFSFPLINQLGWFSLVAILDCFLSLLPKVYNRKKSRSKLIFDRFFQWSGVLIFSSALIGVEKMIEGEEVSGLGGLIGENVYGIGISFIVIAYVFRLIGSFFKLFYGDRSKKVRNKIADNFPTMGAFLKDDDLSGD